MVELTVEHICAAAVVLRSCVRVRGPDRRRVFFVPRRYPRRLGGSDLSGGGDGRAAGGVGASGQ